ncbi:MAG: hypothetical protein AAFR50_11240 [Pseudomonadota bacterium]
MAETRVYLTAPARRRAMLFNLACYALVFVLSGGYFMGGSGWWWALFALMAFLMFATTLKSLTARPFVARIDGTRIETTGPTGKLYSFEASDITAANLDPAARVGVISYTDEGEALAPVSFRMMGPEEAAAFTRHINDLRPGLPAIAKK